MNGSAVSDPAVCCVSEQLPLVLPFLVVSQPKKGSSKFNFSDFYFFPWACALAEGHPIICFGEICLFALFLERGVLIR